MCNVFAHCILTALNSSPEDMFLINVLLVYRISLTKEWVTAKMVRTWEAVRAVYPKRCALWYFLVVASISRAPDRQAEKSTIGE
jgi:hypothetical protein